MAMKKASTKDTTESKDRGTSATTTTSAPPSRDEIARRAYELYLERGGEDGRHEEDWVKAEEELANGLR